LPRISATAWLLPAVTLLAGIVGIDAVWVAIAVASGRPCSWLALLAALDVALLLRLTGVAPGPGRQLLALFATLLAVALAQWLIVATQLGIALGLQPVPSALRLGPSLAIQLMKLSLDRLDLAWLLASLPLAVLLAGRSRRERQLEGEADDAA
jgi:hypothetical protein